MGSEEPAALPNFGNMSKKELQELTARLRLVKPKHWKGYKQDITEHQRQHPIWSRATPFLPESTSAGGWQMASGTEKVRFQVIY